MVVPPGDFTSEESGVCFTAIGASLASWMPAMETTDGVFPLPLAGQTAGPLACPDASCLATIAAFVSFCCSGQTQYTVGGPVPSGPTPTFWHAVQPA